MQKKKLLFLEITAFFKLTAPLLIAQTTQSAMGLVDTLMSGRVSTIAQASVSVGSSIFFPLFLLLVGLISAVMPIVAQANGRGDTNEMTGSIQQGMLLGFCVGLLIMIPIWHIEPALHWMKVDPILIPLVVEYLHAISFGLPVAGLFFSVRNGGDGIARPRLSMITGFVGLGVNIVANYTLIYGKFGAPKLGAVGCGWASALSILAMFISMSILLHRDPRFRKNRLFSHFTGVDFRIIRELIILGTPLGCSLFVECSIFAVISLFISRLGPELVAAHQIALSFSSLTYMIPYSISIAMTVRVGYAIGKKKRDRLTRSVKAGLLLAGASALLTCALILICGNWIATAYTPDTIVQHIAAGLLLFAGIYQIPDAIQANCAGALRGCKDSRIPLLLQLAAYWVIGIPIGYLLGMSGLTGMEAGPQGFWIGLIFALSTAAILLGIRLYYIVARKIIPEMG